MTMKSVQTRLHRARSPSGRERLLQAALGLTLGEAENVFAKIIVKDQRLSADDVGEVFAQKQQIVSARAAYWITTRS